MSVVLLHQVYFMHTIRSKKRLIAWKDVLTDRDYANYFFILFLPFAFRIESSGARQWVHCLSYD
jgi:hypothetical protein